MPDSDHRDSADNMEVVSMRLHEQYGVLVDKQISTTAVAVTKGKGSHSEIDLLPSDDQFYFPQSN